jgi:hypothetical protein
LKVGEADIVAQRDSSKALPGEAQLLDRLVESINKEAYKKKLAVRRETK